MPGPEDTPAEPVLDGRYRLGECIGQGGMARVFRGEDVLLGRPVAIKMIRPGVDDGSSIERARGEVTVLASLNHPSLVTLFDAHLEPGQPGYLVMELVEGPTLSARVASGPVPGNEAAQLAVELAEALHVVHAAGIVHRDVKPSNVLLSPAHLPGRAFRAKLADFGIAYLLDGARVTSTGQVIGTAAYLAPEQVRGEEPVPAGDVYALGLVLLEALTGEPAYPHTAGVASALARLNAPPHIPDTLGTGWADLLAAMTRMEPGERPTALEVAVAAGRLTGATGVGPAIPAAATIPLASVDAGAPASVDAQTLASTDALLPAAAVDPQEPATVALDPAAPPTHPTALLAPVTGADDSGAGGSAVASRRGARGGRPPARRRRAALVGGLAAAAAAIVVVGLWGAGAFGGDPTPVSTAPVVTEPTPQPTPAATTEAPAVVPVDENSGPAGEAESEEARRAAEEEAKRAEDAQRKAEQDARKQAEDQQREAERAARDAERAQREAEEEAAEQAEEAAEDGEAPPANTPAPPPAQPSPAPSASSAG
jgi:eukaryotic-like serine/threonine-protein kinase